MFKRILTSSVLILSLVFTGLMYFSPTVSAATKNPDKVCDFVGQFIDSSLANRPCTMSPKDQFAPQMLGTDGQYYSMESGCFDQSNTGSTISAGSCYVTKDATNGSYIYKVVVCSKDFLGVQSLTCATPNDYSTKIAITTAPFNGATKGVLNCPANTTTVGNTTFKGGALSDGTYAFVVEQCKVVNTVCPSDKDVITVNGIYTCFTKCATGQTRDASNNCVTPAVTPCTNGAVAPACTTCPTDKDGVIMNGAYTCVVKCATGQTRDSSNNCITPKVDQCDINTYGAGKPNCTPCPSGTTSPVGSMTADKCTAVICPNGAVAPACTTCPTDKDGVIMNGAFTCVVKCAVGQTRDASNNCVVTPVVPVPVTPVPPVVIPPFCNPNTYLNPEKTTCTPCEAGFTSPAGSNSYAQCTKPAKKDEGSGFNFGSLLIPALGLGGLLLATGGFGGGKKDEPKTVIPPTPRVPTPRQPVNPCDYYVYGDPRCTPKTPTPRQPKPPTYSVGCPYSPDITPGPNGECGTPPTKKECQYKIQGGPKNGECSTCPSGSSYYYGEGKGYKCTPPPVPGKPQTDGECVDSNNEVIDCNEGSNKVAMGGLAYGYDDEGNPTAVAGQFADENGNVYDSETGEMVNPSTIASSNTDGYNSYASSDYDYENNTSSNDYFSNDTGNNGYNSFETASADYSDGYNPQTYASSDYDYENNTSSNDTGNNGYNSFETAIADYGYDEGY